MRANKRPRQTKRKTRIDPVKALSNYATEKARQAKRKYRAFYAADPHQFRKVYTKATARALRLRPGPKPNALIAQAARERASGRGWNELYPIYIDGHGSMSAHTRGLAEDGL